MSITYAKNFATYAAGGTVPAAPDSLPTCIAIYVDPTSGVAKQDNSWLSVDHVYQSDGVTAVAGEYIVKGTIPAGYASGTVVFCEVTAVMNTVTVKKILSSFIVVPGNTGTLISNLAARFIGTAGKVVKDDNAQTITVYQADNSTIAFTLPFATTATTETVQKAQ